MSKFAYGMTLLYSLWSIVKNSVMKPAAFLCNIFSPILRTYKKIWIALTHNKYDEFVYKRGVAVIIGTAISCFAALVIVFVAFDCAYYLATNKTENIYLSQSEEIYPDDNIWGVKGCYTPECDSTSALYFRIKPSFFNHLWNMTENGHVFFPDIIAATVPTGQAFCEVTSYGLRFRILMMFNIYPSILEVNCKKTGR